MLDCMCTVSSLYFKEAALTSWKFLPGIRCALMRPKAALHILAVRRTHCPCASAHMQPNAACGADPASCLHCCVLLCSDNADLEAVLKETERQRREFAARYAFMTLDTDGDGYVSVEQVRRSCEMWPTPRTACQCGRKTPAQGAAKQLCTCCCHGTAPMPHS